VRHIDPSASTTTRTPTSAVIVRRIVRRARPSTTSRPHRPCAANQPKQLEGFAGKKPPGSGQPVPGTKPQSSEIHIERDVDRIGIFQARSSAISADFFQAELLDVPRW